MKSEPVTWPEPAEEAMLGVIVWDLLTAADLGSHEECRFRRYRIVTDSQGMHRRLGVQSPEGTVLEVEV